MSVNFKTMTSSTGCYGSHLDGVGSHCNVHWVEGIDGLQKCASKGVPCILQVRWEFFAGGGGNGAVPNPIRPDYESLWNKTAEQVTPYIDSVAAFYMIDEPCWNGVSRKNLGTAIAAVKARSRARTAGRRIPAGAAPRAAGRP